MDSLGIKETSLALKDLTPNQEKILLANKEEFEKMNPKDMAMAQLTETQQMSRGIDVIASYYKVRGAEMARGVAKGTGGKEFEELRASIDNYSVSLSKSQKSTIEKDAENSATKVRNDVLRPVKFVEDLFSGKKQPEPTPPPPVSQYIIKHEFGPIPGHVESLGRDLLKNPGMSLQTMGIKNEYTTANVAAKK